MIGAMLENQVMSCKAYSIKILYILKMRSYWCLILHGFYRLFYQSSDDLNISFLGFYSQNMQVKHPYCLDLLFVEQWIWLLSEGKAFVSLDTR